MKSVINTMILTAALVGALALPLTPVRSAAATDETTTETAGKERHPHIRHAIRELEAAREELKTGAHDFGGHRVDAIKACDQALEQLKKALEADKN